MSGIYDLSVPVTLIVVIVPVGDVSARFGRVVECLCGRVRAKSAEPHLAGPADAYRFDCISLPAPAGSGHFAFVNRDRLQ
jgi:hypothetical protein